MDWLRRVLFFPDDDGGGSGGDGAGGDDGGDGGAGGDGAGDVGGGSAVDWRSSLPDDVKADPTIASYKTVEDLAKSHISAQKKLGNNVAIPGKDATEEQRNEFFNKIGRPETADKYELPEVEGAERLGLPPETDSKLKAEAHRLGLTQRQAAGLYEFYLKENLSALDAAEQRMGADSQKQLQDLKTEWGGAFDEKLGQAREAVSEFGGQELTQLLNDTGFGDHPVLIKTFAEIGKSMAQDKLYGRGQETTGRFSMTPAEATAEIGRKMQNSDFVKAYTDSQNPGHAAAVAEMQKLHEAQAAGQER